MEVNFDAAVRLTEALLPLLRAAAPSSIVNVSSVAGRVGRPKNGAYAASKFALAGWSEAVGVEEEAARRARGRGAARVHLHRGLPARPRCARACARAGSSRRRSRSPRRSSPPGPGGKREVYVPRFYGLVPKLRHLVPGLTRRSLGGGRF